VSDSLKISQKLEGKILHIDLEGVINEDSDFSKISIGEASHYFFDFEKIDGINSCGIRDWINFLEKFPASCQITYQQCPQIIIEQINMVEGFIRQGVTVESFFAPYYIPSLDQEKAVLLRSQDIKNGKAPVIIDPDTNEELEFDGIEEQYFYFLKHK